MIFSEVYGNYFNAVAEILEKAVNHELTGEELTKSVRNHAFEESLFPISANMGDESWPLLRKDYTTPIRYAPEMPLTTLQKQWLKAILQDPRIQLFGPSDEGLEDVEPLFTPDMFVFFDQYSDGDPYEDGEYIRNFRIILSAIKNHRKVRVRFKSGKGNRQSWVIFPQKLEYSLKDDKFRMLFTSPNGRLETINLGRIKNVTLQEKVAEDIIPIARRQKQLVFDLKDERNALERCMLHFSDLRKETEKTGSRRYRIKLYYESEDEAEILIRILSFGPVIKVVEPDSFIALITERLQKQEQIHNTQ